MDLASMTLEQGLMTLRQADSPLVEFLKSARRNSSSPQIATTGRTAEKRAFNISQQAALGGLLGGGFGGAYGYLQSKDDDSPSQKLNRSLLYGLGGAAAGGAGGEVLRKVIDAPPVSGYGDGSFWRAPSAKYFNEQELNKIKSRYGVAPANMSPGQAAEYLDGLRTTFTGGLGSTSDYLTSGYVQPIAGLGGMIAGEFAGQHYGQGIRQLDLTSANIQELLKQNMQAKLIDGVEFTTGQGKGTVKTTRPPTPTPLPTMRPSWWENRARSLGFSLNPETRAWLDANRQLDPRPGSYVPLTRAGGFRTPAVKGNVAGGRLGSALGALGGLGAMLGLGGWTQNDMGAYNPLSIIPGLGSKSYYQSAGAAPTRAAAEAIIKARRNSQ